MFKVGKLVALSLLLVTASVVASEEAQPKGIIKTSVEAVVKAFNGAAGTTKLYAWNLGYNDEALAGLSGWKAWGLNGYKAALVVSAVVAAYYAAQWACGKEDTKKKKTYKTADVLNSNFAGLTE